MAKKTKAAPRRRKITLIESDEGAEATRSRMKLPLGRRAVEVDLVVRSPDKAAARSLAATARLCRCQRVCIALV